MGVGSIGGKSNHEVMGNYVVVLQLPRNFTNQSRKSGGDIGVTVDGDDHPGEEHEAQDLNKKRCSSTAS